MDLRGKLVLRQALGVAVLRRDARNQAALRIGQIVRRGLTQDIDGRADFVQIGIGADGGKLRRPVAARAGAKGFVIVPKKGVLHGRRLWHGWAQQGAWPMPQFFPMPRFYCPSPLAANTLLDLPANAARHVQVLRMQPGQSIELFNGEGGAWQAEIVQMTRSGVQVRLGGADAHDATERELATPIHIAISLPANERMDWLVEKATELGVASISPLMSSRSVLRLSTTAGDARAEKKRAHWQAIAQGAAEQCGRNRLPVIAAVQDLATWLKHRAGGAAAFVLSPPDGENFQAKSLFEAVNPAQAAHFLIGPEGGFSAEELQAAQAAGCSPCHLGARVLRAETAPLYILAALAARELAAQG